MFSVQSFVLGAGAFLLTLLGVVAGWRSWFDPDGAHNPWFLNSGRAVAFTIVSLFLISAGAGALASGPRRDHVVEGIAFGVGAAVSMALVLFSGDAGTRFPIVLAVGAAIALGSGVAGATAAGALRQRFSGVR